MSDTRTWTETAVRLTEHLCPVLVLAPGLKRPVPMPHDKGWWIYDSPDGCDVLYGAAKRVAGGEPNLGVLLGWEKQSPICVVDLDVHHNPKAVDQAREFGVSSKDSVWVAKTGRGGFHVYYRLPHEFDCKRSTAAAAGDGSAIDLLVNGYVVVPPSDTSKEPQGGGPYTWVRGHSPFDLVLLDLPHPPEPLVQWWRERLAKTQAAPSSPNHAALSIDRVLAGVPEGERNEALFRYASSLRARGVRLAEAEALVLQAAAHCSPPLQEHEAKACLESAWKYQDGATGWHGVKGDQGYLL